MVTTDGANPFGQGIPFCTGKPIQLLHVDIQNGNLILNPEAIKILEAIPEAVACVSIGNLDKKYFPCFKSDPIKTYFDRLSFFFIPVGTRQSGKSHLANVL